MPVRGRRELAANTRAGIGGRGFAGGFASRVAARVGQCRGFDRSRIRGRDVPAVGYASQGSDSHGYSQLSGGVVESTRAAAGRATGSRDARYVPGVVESSVRTLLK